MKSGYVSIKVNGKPHQIHVLMADHEFRRGVANEVAVLEGEVWIDDV
tara:strand:+ start:1717 stop:1857 length:141 start_codon:yes stop_codon:yes gene_type:complete